MLHKDGTLIRMCGTSQYFRDAYGLVSALDHHLFVAVVINNSFSSPGALCPLTKYKGSRPWIHWNKPTLNFTADCVRHSRHGMGCPTRQRALTWHMAVAFSKEDGILRQGEDIAEQRKEVIRTGEKQEWIELLLRVQASISAQLNTSTPGSPCTVVSSSEPQDPNPSPPPTPPELSNSQIETLASVVTNGTFLNPSVARRVGAIINAISQS